MFRWLAAIWWIRWGMLMREGRLLPPCEPCLRCLALGESEEGGPPVPLGVENTMHSRVMVVSEGSVAAESTWMKQSACNMKLLSTYFPESLQQGGVEGNLGELCNDTINKAESCPKPNVDIWYLKRKRQQDFLELTRPTCSQTNLEVVKQNFGVFQCVVLL